MHEFDNIIVNNKLIEKVRYVEDCKMLKAILFDKGFDLTLQECEKLWYDVSEAASASWLNVSEDNLNEFLFNTYWDEED